MFENLDLVTTAILELIKHNEFNQANAKVHEAISKMQSSDMKGRQDKIREIVKSINSLKKAKHYIESAVQDIPVTVQFHAKEGMRPALEEIEKHIACLLSKKKHESRPS